MRACTHHTPDTCPLGLYASLIDVIMIGMKKATMEWKTPLAIQDDRRMTLN